MALTRSARRSAAVPVPGAFFGQVVTIFQWKVWAGAAAWSAGAESSLQPIRPKASRGRRSSERRRIGSYP